MITFASTGEAALDTRGVATEAAIHGVEGGHAVRVVRVIRSGPQRGPYSTVRPTDPNGRVGRTGRY